MNNSQRDYLIGTISKEKVAQVEALKKKVPKKPELNGYLIKAIIRGEAVFKPTEEIKKFFEKLTDAEDIGRLKITENSWYEDDKIDMLYKIHYSAIFEKPQAYKKAMEEYKGIKLEVDMAIKEIEANYKQVELRLKVASNKVLESITAQVDDLGDLDLLNMTLMGESAQKLLK